MKVYHGSNQDISDIDLKRGIRFKDFGQGFYVTPDIDTARRMAYKKVDLLGGTPTIITYEFDETVLSSCELNILVFPERATAEWILFIEKNRNRRKPIESHTYDIIKGPIADDGVALLLGRVRTHADRADSIAIALQDKYLDQQIYFGTPASLKYLIKVDVCQIK